MGRQRQRELPDYSRWELAGGQRRKYYTAAGGGLFLLGYLFYHSLPAALLAMALACLGEGQYKDYLAEKRRKELAVQFRDMLYALSAAVSAGRQLPTAILEAKDQLESAYGKEAVLYKELEYMARSMAESNQPPEFLLQDFAQRSCIEEIKQFAHICRICKKTGGDLERVVGKTAEVLLEKLSISMEIQMVTAQKRLEAKILTVIPIVMVFFLNVVSPDYLAVLYEGLAGRLVMTLALGGMGISYLLSRKITDIQV